MTPWTAGCQASLSNTNSRRLLKLMSIESVMPSGHFILCRPLLLLPSILPSIKVFSDESVLCIRWPWSFSYSICPSKKYSGLISFRIDWFDLLAVQSACSAGDLGSIPGLGRFPWKGKGYLLQYSGLENSVDCIVHGIAKRLVMTEWLSPYFTSAFFMVQLSHPYMNTGKNMALTYWQSDVSAF